MKNKNNNKKAFNHKARSQQQNPQLINLTEVPFDTQIDCQIVQEPIKQEYLQRKLPTSFIEPETKPNAKKRKRMEKFIKKQIKKQDRVKILEKLGQNKFEAAELLHSSKSIGRKNLTMKERLRNSLLQERAGFDIYTPDQRLFVNQKPKEEILEEITEDDSMIVEEADSEKEPDEETASIPEKRSLLSQAFGSALKKPEIDQESKKITVISDSGVVTQEQVPEVKVLVKKPAFGSSLKKPEANLINQDLSSSEDEEDYTRNDTWKLDVVSGEKFDIPKSQTIEVEKAEQVKPQEPVEKSAPAFYVPVNRPAEIQIARIHLPVVAEEQPIMEAIMKNDVVILCGETGSGKTTQVPQFLYEAGFGDPKHPEFPGVIGITQPRRVAAISMAKRVSQEMGFENSNNKTVGYQVRYDAITCGKETRVKFMTDGILLKELSSSTTSTTSTSKDLLLSQYSCIIIDEAHERTVGTDVLIGWLTRICKLRNTNKLSGIGPLKIIIMSATLRVDDFTLNKTLFNASIPPVVKVDGRQHRVVVHYNKKTPHIDYVTEALNKVSKIHTKLPHGAILVFLSGQQEIQILVRKLQEKFPMKNLERIQQQSPTTEQQRKHENFVKGQLGFFDGEDEAEDLHDDFQEDVADKEAAMMDDEDYDSEEEEKHILNGNIDDEEHEIEIEEDDEREAMPLYVLPLYSLLSSENQMKVFEPVPEGTRLCVVATNIAETSLTIPGIKYVVDCGKAKERKYDASTGLHTFQIGWTSKASADQRAGRAGRVGPGHCYRLFSSAVFNDYFEQFQQPEILRVPIEGVVLQMKAMGIDQIVNFPFPTPPGKDNLRGAEKLLVTLGALTLNIPTVASPTPKSSITSLGMLMSNFPVHPRFSKMIILAAQQTQSSSILLYIITVVSGLSVGDIFIHEDTLHHDEEESEAQSEERRAKRGQFYRVMQMFSGDTPTSDSLRILFAIGAYLTEYSKSTIQANEFCNKHFIRIKAMEEMRKLRNQLLSLTKKTLTCTKSFPFVSTLNNTTVIKPPTKSDLTLIKQILFSGYPDHVARLDEDIGRRIPSYGGKNKAPVYQSMWSGVNEVLCIHPSSCLARERPASKWIIFDEVTGREERLTASNDGLIDTRKTLTGENATVVVNDPTKDVKKIWMKGVTVINEKWLTNLAPRSLLAQSRILENPSPRFDDKRDTVVAFSVCSFGPKLWPLPIIELSGDDLTNIRTKSSWFAKSLMEGKVSIFDKKKKVDWKGGVFEIIQPYLITKANIFPKPYARKTKVASFLEKLESREVYSKAALLQQWKRDPKFLLAEFLEWIPEQLHARVAAGWPFIGDDRKLKGLKQFLDKCGRIGSDEDSS